MKLAIHKTAQDFLTVAQDFLLAHEVENCVMLGSACRMIAKPRKSDSDSDTYFATVALGGEVVAAVQWQPPHNIFLTGAPVAAIELIASDMAQHHFSPTGITAPPMEADAFVKCWRERKIFEIKQDYGFRIYRLEKVIPPRPRSGSLRLATTKDETLAAEWAEAFDTDVDYGNPAELKKIVQTALEENRLYFWQDQQPVSFLFRNAPTPNSERVSVVYTPPELRGKGYGSAANAALAQIILDSGKRYACLFADVTNAVSNKMYLNIGYEVVSDVHRYKFIYSIG